MTVDAAKDLLLRRLGLRFEGPAELRLRQALSRRMAAAGRPRLGDYLAHLRRDDAEFDALTSLVTIKETYFFREPEHLRLLTEVLAPPLLANRDAAIPLRILSAGCATGEEPYSIAIALVERFGAGVLAKCAIEGRDVDPGAISAAMVAQYRQHAVRALEPARLARWFTPVNGGWLLTAAIRDAVRFRVLNLLDETYPAALRGCDLIFYRNLSIYFDPPTRAEVLRRLKGLLRPHGVLIVGIAETLANNLGVLPLHEHDGVWYFCNDQEPAAPDPLRIVPLATAVAQAPLLAAASQAASPQPDPATAADPAAPASCPLPPVAADPGSAPAAPGLYERACALAGAERFGEALALLQPPAAAGAANLLALRATLLAAHGDATLAAAAAREALALDPWSVPALVLLGQQARAAGRVMEAIDWLRRAIYVRPGHWPAHLALADCWRESGEPQAARRGYRAALRLLADEPRALAEVRPMPPALPLADLRRFCEARLAEPASAY